MHMTPLLLDMGMNLTPLTSGFNYSLSGSQTSAQYQCNLWTCGMKVSCRAQIMSKFHSNWVVQQRNPPKYVGYHRRPKFPPEPQTHSSRKKEHEVTEKSQIDLLCSERPDQNGEQDTKPVDHSTLGSKEDGDIETISWDEEEIDAISSLFQGRIPQKPGKLTRQRPIPLPMPHKLQPSRLPSVKRFHRTSSLPRSSSLSMIYRNSYKDPLFLANLAREIQRLPREKDASIILQKWGRFLRKGSLSFTICELGHMGLPDRSLQTLCWAQKQPHLFPDDRILASTVETLASSEELKISFNLERFMASGSVVVLEAMARGFIKARRLGLARKLLVYAKKSSRILDSSIYAKLILELGKNPDKGDFAVSLLEELAVRDNLNLTQTDCTAIMKICARLGKFELAESLFKWFQQSDKEMNVVMYTTIVHCRYCENKLREALALVWEMEASNCLFDLPAYRVVIKLFIALDDISRAARYFSKLKDAGFSPTYDIYRDMIGIYMVSGRLAKCKELCKELELAGYKLDPLLSSQLQQL